MGKLYKRVNDYMDVFVFIMTFFSRIFWFVSYLLTGIPFILSPIFFGIPVFLRARKSYNFLIGDYIWFLILSYLMLIPDFLMSIIVYKGLYHIFDVHDMSAFLISQFVFCLLQGRSSAVRFNDLFYIVDD